jgi:hypothetical protein
MHRILRSKPAAVAAALAGAAVLIWACASSQRVVTDGVSTTTVTATKKVCLKAKGPLTFPGIFPAIGGMHLAPGVEVDICLEPGEQIVFHDRVGSDGVTITEVVQQPADALPHVANATDALTARPAPQPIVRISYNSTVQPGSTYSWQIPSLFGDSEATVEVAGSLSAVLRADALVGDGNGGWSLQNGGLLSASYQVSGPPAVWQGPIDTPYGTIEGTGTIETSDGMVLSFTGDVGGVSFSGTEGYTDPDGVAWEYGYVGAYPVTLTVGAGEATGATTVSGGADTTDL